MPHNHPPRCCCGIPGCTCQGALHEECAKPCPSCVEHGELASLSKPHAIAYNPADEDEDDAAGETVDLVGRLRDSVEAARARRRNECPSCHTHDGHPHTDYCQRRPHPTHRFIPVENGQANFPRVCAACMAREDTSLATRPCDRLGQDVPAPISIPTQTSTPPTRTTTPSNTQRRSIVSELEHIEWTGSRRTTHLRALCRPDLCGLQPTPSQ